MNKNQKMEVYEPHCLKCGALLEVYECMDIDEEEGQVRRDVLGECPECETQYRWEEVYTYARYENLEELED